MSDLDEIRSRLGSLEDEVARMREDASATRTLAAMADRDASEVRGALRAHTQLLNALRATQAEQGRAMETIAHAIGGLATEQAHQSETLARQGDALAELTTMVRCLIERSE
jgi:chromosome segregation ATPase